MKYFSSYLLFLLLTLILLSCRESLTLETSNYPYGELPKGVLRTDKEVYGSPDDFKKAIKIEQYETTSNLFPFKYDILEEREFYYLQPYLQLNVLETINFLKNTGIKNSIKQEDLQIKFTINQINTCFNCLLYTEISSVIIKYPDLSKLNEKTVKLIFYDVNNKRPSFTKDYLNLRYIDNTGLIYTADIDLRNRK